jgi:hypothetical protein
MRPRAALRTAFAGGIDDAAGEAMLEHLRAASAPMAAAQIRVLGGATARVPAEATAFAHRDSRIMVNVVAMYQRAEERPVHEAWVAGLAAGLPADGTGAYAGFLGDEGEARVRAAYPGATWDRLTAVKARYDPDNLFRLNQNIPPSGQGSPRPASAGRAPRRTTSSPSHARRTDRRRSWCPRKSPTSCCSRDPPHPGAAP